VCTHGLIIAGLLASAAREGGVILRSAGLPPFRAVRRGVSALLRTPVL
jgi:hypothetical protein